MPFSFFLGGHDLEMETIRDLLRTRPDVHVHDRHLAWGAKASTYAQEIAAAIAGGRTPALVELERDVPLPPDAVIIVDHHGGRAGERAPTSLEQVFALLEARPEAWTRWMTLVAANDRGHIDGLLDIGATREEISAVRYADRAAQGVTDEEEIKAVDSIAKAKHPVPGLTVVRLPHGRTSPVTDLLHPALGGPGYDCLAVLSPGEVNVFADGETVAALDSRFPGGWTGGSLPTRGFWGTRRNADALAFLLERLSARAGRTPTHP